MKNARAKILFFIVKYAILWGFYCSRRLFSHKKTSFPAQKFARALFSIFMSQEKSNTIVMQNFGRGGTLCIMRSVKVENSKIGWLKIKWQPCFHYLSFGEGKKNYPVNVVRADVCK